MQTRSSGENFVCASVCLSVKRVDCDKTEDKCVQIFIPYERSFSLVFWEKEWKRPLLSEYFGSTGSRCREIADFEPIIARSASAVRPSEKSSINTNRKSTTRFSLSLWRSSYVSPKSPKGGSKTQNGRFPSKIALRLKKVCYKVSLCENCQQLSYRAFTGLTILQKLLVGTSPSTCNFGSKWPRWSEVADFRSIFASSALSRNI